MYNVLDIAIYTINYSHEKSASITNLKLQKILYYTQAAFLVEKGMRCFEAAIMAWAFGPVIPEVYQEYKRYGREEIPTQRSREELCFNEKKFGIIRKKIEIEKEIKGIDKEIIDNVIEAYADIRDPFELVRKTHEEDPWVNASKNEEISCDIIEKYYSKNPRKIYGQ